jgi:hypothetical protein
MVKPRLRAVATSVLLSCALILGACADGIDAPRPEVTPPAPSALGARLDCSADVRRGEVSCTPALKSGGAATAIILGGQGTYVHVGASGASYSGGVFSANFTVQNLTAQRIGTVNGSSLDANGVRVFINGGPIVTSGTGTVTVANATGAATFTAANQPYFQYDQILDQFGGTSTPKVWQFNVPSTVNLFAFSVLVSAATINETGILRWNFERGLPIYASSIWGLDARNVFALGGGTIDRFDGTAWHGVFNDSAGTFLRTMWGSSPSDIWVATNFGDMYHYNGTSWAFTPRVTSTASSIMSFWGTGPGDVWAVTNSGGNILHYNGTSWSIHTAFPGTPPTGVQWRGVSGSGPNDVWAVGTNGTIKHYTGSTWDAVPSTTTQMLNGVWATKDTAYAVGAGGTILHWNGSAWAAESSPTTSIYRAVHGLSGSDVWAAADGGIFRRVNGAWVTTSFPGGYLPQSIWGTSPTNMWAIAFTSDGLEGDGVPFHYDGASWRASASVGASESTPAGRSLANVWGTSTTNVWAVGTDGVILQLSSGSWRPVGNETVDYFGIWGTSASNMWFFGDRGSIRRFTGTALTHVASPTGARLLNAWGPAGDPNNIWAVGTGGTIIKWDGSAWTTQSSGTQNAITGIWGTSTSDIWAVGQGCVILHYNGTAWSSSASGCENDLSSVWGLATNDMWAVGTGGIILHWNGSAWSQPARTTTADLTRVWGLAANNARIVGRRGVMLHMNAAGTTWGGPSPAGVSLDIFGVWSPVAGNWYTVGQRGWLAHGTR